MGGGWHQGNLALLVEAMSDSVVHCHSQRDYVSTVATNGVELHISKVDGTTGQEQTIGQARIGFDTVVECPERWPDPPHKPYCLLSVQDQFEIYMEVELVRGDSPEERRPRILVRNQARLPVGWECIEVFPGLDMDYWKPEYARSWAESDILAAVVRAQTTEAAFNSLDPTASARKQKASLLKEYKELLDSNPEREEVLQAFLKKHPELICPTHIRMRPKLALGRRVTDFVFQEAAGGYLLVELEGSSDPLFLANGDRSAELRHAQDQIVDWKRYLEDNLGTVQHELGLAGISVNPSSLIIIGRSRLLRPEDRRKLTTFHNESPTVTILTYDDVYESAKAVIENLLGPLWIVPAGSTVVYYLGTGGQTPPQH